MPPRHALHVSVKEIEGQLLVLDRQHGQLHELNATAGFIWRHCDGRHEVVDIAAALAAEFDIDPVTAGKDVTAILEQFESRQLIQYQPPIPRPS